MHSIYYMNKKKHLLQIFFGNFFRLLRIITEPNEEVWEGGGVFRPSRHHRVLAARKNCQKKRSREINFLFTSCHKFCSLFFAQSVHSTWLLFGFVFNFLLLFFSPWLCLIYQGAAIYAKWIMCIMVVKFKYVVKHFISAVDSLPCHEKLSAKSLCILSLTSRKKWGNAYGNYRRK